jgi:hypothetical protein
VVVVDDRLSVFHKVVLWFCIVTSFIIGFGNYFAPVFTTSLLKVNGSDLISITCIGGFLLAAVVGAAFSLKSNSWKESRIANYYLATWCILNGLRMALNIIVDRNTGLMPNCVFTLLIGIGLVVEICRRSCPPKNKTA